LVALNVSDNSPNVTVTENNNFLLANATGASYQWLNCTTNAPISGAVNQSFIPISNGDYAVIVTQNACSDTSECYNFSTAGLEFSDIGKINIYPNPAQSVFQIRLPIWIDQAEMSLLDFAGNQVYTSLISGNEFIFQRSNDIVSGIYLVIIRSKGSVMIGKLALY
jgi:hypothetical protein